MVVKRTDGQVVECASCKKKDALMWTKKANGTVICQDCALNERELAQVVLSEQPVEPKGLSDKPITLRKSTRMARSYKTRSNQNQIKTGRGKKKSLPKRGVGGPVTVSGNKLVACTRIFVGDSYLQVADIVSIMGLDEKIYFAQLTALFVDSLGEQSALITWLVPVQGARPGIFDPEYYVIGPSEETPRKITGMVFERRLPRHYLRFNVPSPVAEDPAPFRQTVVVQDNFLDHLA